MSLRYPSGFISAGFNPLEVPNAPTIGTASIASATSVSVTFTAPSNVGGSAITGYVATAKKTSDGTTISGTGSSSPVTISGLTTGDAYTVTVAAVNSYGLGVSSAASNSVTPQAFELYAWGENRYGKLGLNDTIARSSPVQVGALITWQKISIGSQNALAVKTDGTMWSWGRNQNGQLGQNDTTYRSSPVQIGALTEWAEISSASTSSLAIKINGTLWAWGTRSFGALGDNNAYGQVSSPVQIGALTAWSQVASGNYHSIAIKTDGTIWSWGRNDQGQLGLNDTVNRSSPVQVGALTTWSKVSAGGSSQGICFAIKTDGTLWSWGNNYSGRLGLNDTTARSSPVQIGALTTWSRISAGGAQGVAIKTDGTMWSWGAGTFGRLGLNDTYNRSSPVQIGGLATWSQIACGRDFSLAIVSDGTMWSWGRNNYGKLGLNDTANRSIPVQVGALTTWTSLAKMTENDFSFAINS